MNYSDNQLTVTKLLNKTRDSSPQNKKKQVQIGKKLVKGKDK